MGSPSQNFHRDQFRISKSKQDKSNIDCLAFKEKKEKATEFFLSGRKFYNSKKCQIWGSIFPVVLTAPGHPLGNKGARSPSCGIGWGQSKRQGKLKLGPMFNSRTNLKVEARGQEFCSGGQIPFLFTSKWWFLFFHCGGDISIPAKLTCGRGHVCLAVCCIPLPANACHRVGPPIKRMNETISQCKTVA